MNTRRRRVLIVVAVLFVGMMLYPPLSVEGIPNVIGSRNPGFTHIYGWLFTGNIFATVELGLLFTQFFVVGVVGVIAFILCADKK